MAEPRYRMTIDLTVLDGLGVKLYSNVAAVLTEAVANSWDSDATTVRIDLDIDNDSITIADDGIGMKEQDVNDKYLRVGYRRREAGETVTAKGRSVMGRKGLGKLALFSIAKTIEVQTVKDGQQNGLVMHYDKIVEARNQNTEYCPAELPAKKITVKKGTTLRLSDLQKKRLEVTQIALKRRLARRFSIIGSKDFRVFVNNDEITAKDRGDLEVVQFLWNIGPGSYQSQCPDLKEHEKLNGTFNGVKIQGWIGTAGKPKQLETEAGNLNSIVVLARGRLLIENVLDKINASGLYTKYICGQIEADFLDVDNLEDIVTSDRQRVLENDERYDQLLDIVKTILNQVEKRWDEWRRNHGTEEVAKDFPAVQEWVDSLPENYRRSATGLLSRIGAIPVEHLNDRKELLRHAIFAFERLKLRGAAEELVAAMDGNAENLLKLLADHASVEGSLYRDIVTSRLETIKLFDGLVDANLKEKVLQEALAKDLWLLDASWERATGNPLVEKRLRQEGVIVDDLTQKEKTGRVDIYYRTTAGKHVIVELKRAKRKPKLAELEVQGRKYVDTLRKILSASGEKNPNIEVVFVVGKALDEETSNPERIKHAMNSISPGSRVVQYDLLIHGALRAYDEYLKASQDADRILKITEKL